MVEDPDTSPDNMKLGTLILVMSPCRMVVPVISTKTRCETESISVTLIASPLISVSEVSDATVIAKY